MFLTLQRRYCTGIWLWCHASSPCEMLIIILNKCSILSQIGVHSLNNSFSWFIITLRILDQLWNFILFLLFAFILLLKSAAWKLRNFDVIKISKNIWTLYEFLQFEVKHVLNVEIWLAIFQGFRQDIFEEIYLYNCTFRSLSLSLSLFISLFSWYFLSLFICQKTQNILHELDNEITFDFFWIFTFAGFLLWFA